MLSEPDALSPELEALLVRAMFPDPERIRRTLEGYRNDPQRRVFGWRVDGRTVSAAGVRQHGEEVEILHLGTTSGEEGRGHARALLHSILAHLNAARLVAETDDGAVEFYRRAGFEVTPAQGRLIPLPRRPHPALSFFLSSTASRSTRSFSPWPSWPRTHTKVRA